MRLPQELLDEIIGHFDLSRDFDHETSKTLRSCALVSRALARPSQMALFCRISSWDYFEDNHEFCEHFLALLSSSRHLVGYIRTLDIELPYKGLDLTLHILAAVTQLHTLIMRNSYSYPTPFPRDSSVFALPTLRRVELSYFHFLRPQELHLALLKAVSLEELVLSDIRCLDETENTSFPAIDEKVGSDCGPRLKSLGLIRVKRGQFFLEALDIRHLESLTLSARPWPSPLSVHPQVNLMSLRHIKVINIWGDQELTPMVLERGNQLRSLEFEIDSLGTVVSPSRLLLLFGDLHNLTALETIRIGVANNFDTYDLDSWAPLDALLTHTGRCDFQIHAQFDEPSQPTDFIEKRFPLLAARGRLHVYTNRTAHRITRLIS